MARRWHAGHGGLRRNAVTSTFALSQRVERTVRNVEVGGWSPLTSTQLSLYEPVVGPWPYPDRCFGSMGSVSPGLGHLDAAVLVNEDRCARSRVGGCGVVPRLRCGGLGQP
jgi:hypothetical protein